MCKQDRSFYLLLDPHPFVNLQRHYKKYRKRYSHGYYRVIYQKSICYHFYKENEKWGKADLFMLRDTDMF